MQANERLVKVISTLFGVPADQIGPEDDMDTIDRWDSLGHLNLIMAVEREFKVKFRSDQIPKLTSVALLQEALVTLGAI